MFVGRKDILNELTEAYESGVRRFMLHGIGGVGKSWTFRKFANQYKQFYPAQIFVDMRGLDAEPVSADKAMERIIYQFNPEQTISADSLKEIYLHYVQQQPTMLFLDNAHNLADVEPLLDASGICVFVTSRNLFNLPQPQKRIELKKMSAEDSVSLLHQIAGESRFDGKAQEVAKLAGYLPMALKVLAAIFADDIDEDETVDTILGKYRNIQNLFKERVPEYDGLTIDASFELSYQRLTADLQRHWRFLSVFPADFNVDAVNAVLQIDNGQAVKTSLRQRSLLEMTDNKRLRFHDLARVYANSKLSDVERFEANKLHAGHFVLILWKAREIRDTNTKTCFLDSLQLIDQEWTNIVTGQSWAAANFNKNAEIAGFCSDFTGAYADIDLRLSRREHIEWLNSALNACRKIGDRQGEGNHLGNLGIAYFSLGDYHKAIDYYEQALLISIEIGHRQGEGNRLGNLGIAYDSLGDYPKAIKYHEQALLISIEIGHRQGEGNRLGNLGNAYASLGDYHKAIEYYEQALLISIEIGHRQGEGNRLGNLGSAYASLGDYHKAIDYYEQALLISIEIGDRQGEGNRLGNLGTAYLSLGDYHKAIEYYEQALLISIEIGHRQGEGNRLGNLGLAYANLGEKDKAKDYYLQSIAILEAIGSPNAEVARQILARLES
jgi:tetratricopeptide (TPR) repeat protein